MEDVMEPYSPPRAMSFEEIVSQLTNALHGKAVKYGTGCKDLDALVYVNLENRYLDAKSIMPDLSKLRAQGWRSVSVVFPPYSVVLYAETTAPSFIRTASGGAVSKCDDLDTLFDVE
jgi:hypothetical protein